jgi:signal transduction histidine kinase
MIESTKDIEKSIYAKYYRELIDLATHDLDAPLRKLTILIDRMMVKINAGDVIDGQAVRVQSCISDMRAMIDGLARLSEVSFGTTTIVSVDIELLVSEAIAKLQRKAAEKTFTAHYSNLVSLEGDETLLKFLITELLENSFQFSSEEHPLHISIEGSVATDEEKNRFKLSQDMIYHKIGFRDNGTGFVEQEALKIFEPFVRLHGKSHSPGAGIGLSICRRIAENHGGVLYATANEPAGALFVLLLPQSLDKC